MTKPEDWPFKMSIQRPEVDAIPSGLRDLLDGLWPPTDEAPMTLTLPVKDVRTLAAHLRHVAPVDVGFDPGWLADELRSQVEDHYRTAGSEQ